MNVNTQEFESKLHRLDGFDSRAYTQSKKELLQLCSREQKTPDSCSLVDIGSGSENSPDSTEEIKYYPYTCWAAIALGFVQVVGIDIGKKGNKIPEFEDYLEGDLVKIVRGQGLSNFLNSKGLEGQQNDFVFYRGVTTGALSPHIDKQLRSNQEQINQFEERLLDQAEGLLKGDGLLIYK